MLEKTNGRNKIDVANNPALSYLGGLSKMAQITMGGKLNSLADTLKPGATAETYPWHELRFNTLQGIQKRLVDAGYKHSTVNNYIYAVRGVLKQAWLLGKISEEDYRKTVRIKSVKGETVLSGRRLSFGEITAIFQTCNGKSPKDVRDAAIMAVLYSGGLRRTEAVKADFFDFSGASGQQLLVNGKGNRQRIVHFSNGGLNAILDWLDIRGDWEGPLFCPVNKSGNLQQKRMTSQAVYNMLKKRAVQAGIPDFSPHDLRRTCASDLLENGVDLSTVSRILGHADLNVTRRYDMRGEEAKKKAVATLHVPYK